MFDNLNVNPRKNEGFLTSIPCIPIPEYGQSNAPLMFRFYSVKRQTKILLVNWGCPWAFEVSAG